MALAAGGKDPLLFIRQLMHPRGPDSAGADILLESKFRSERIYKHPFFATVAFRPVALRAPGRGWLQDR